MPRIKAQTALLIFAKAPVPGQVKTRLIPALGATGATEIHNQLLRQTLATARRSSIRALTLCCAPDARHPALLEYAERFSLRLEAQVDGDLGERMGFALEQALQDHRQALLIGSDCVELTEFDLDLARRKLAEGCEVVLGPAHDHGYYLIGMTAPHRQLFTGIEWGTDRVLAETRKRITQLNLKRFELPARRDIDRPEDLEWLSRHRARQPLPVMVASSPQAQGRIS